jgi:DNA recombination protein RmuC
MIEVLLWAVAVVVVSTAGLVVVLLTRRTTPPEPFDTTRLEALVRDESAASRRELAESLTRTREELQRAQSSLRSELLTSLESFQKLSSANREELVSTQNVFRTEISAKLDAFGEQQLTRFNAADTRDAEKSKSLRDEIHALFQRQAESLAASATRLSTLVDENLKSLRESNEQRLDQMRLTVDEKLQSTLDKRLGENFGQVSKTLADLSVQLGELRAVGGNVKDLTRVLTNVKTRGVWGEVQLGAILEEMLPGHYETNFAPTGRGERVEFAIKLPGEVDGEHVYLPIDAKFPIEDYQRLIAASDAANPEAVAAAVKQLNDSIWSSARDISRKYLKPPTTTNFGILFLPIEGLYAEVARSPGLVEELQRELRIMVAGPSTLAAMLNALQMGFRTLAVQKRSEEIGKLLEAVKAQFLKYADTISAVRKTLDTAVGKLDDVEERAKQINRRLAKVTALPDEQADKLLPPGIPADE